ncbi:MAG: hypothetical protein AAF997_01135 [Myxococcota bacterium]
MDLGSRVDALERAILRLGIRFVEEELPEEAHIDGGLYRIDGEQVLVVSPTAPPWRRAEVLLDALRRLPHDDIFLPPELRQLVQGEDFREGSVRLVPSVVERPGAGGPKEDDR